MRNWLGSFGLVVCFCLSGSLFAQLDNDNNGLSDVWESMFDPVPLPINSDADDDTLSTLQECIAGTDPRNNRSLHDVSEYFSVNGRSEVNYFRLRYRSQPGKEYKLRVAHPGEMSFTELDDTLMLGNGLYQYIYQYHSGLARGAGGVFADVWNQLPGGVNGLNALSATTAQPDATLSLPELHYENDFGHSFGGMRVRGYFRSYDESGLYTISLDTSGSGTGLFKIGTPYGAPETTTNLFQAGFSSPVGNSPPVELRIYQPYPFEINFIPNNSGIEPEWKLSMEIPGNTNAPPETPFSNQLLFWVDSDRSMNPLLADSNISVFDVLVRDRDGDNDGVTDWEELELELAPWNPATFGNVPDATTAANLLNGSVQNLALDANPATTLIEGAGSPVTFTLRRLLGSGPLTVPYSIGGQSESSDVNASASAFVFANGQNVAQVSFSAANDNRLEPAEFAVITIEPPPTATLTGSPYGGFTIEDELDPQPILFVAEYGPEGDAETQATGFSSLLLSADRSSALVSSSFENLTSPQTTAHIHRGAVGVSGPVVQGLPTSGPFEDLVWQFGAPPADMDMPGMVMLAADHQRVLDDLTVGRLYANVHSAMYGSGEIRGNYVLSDGSDFFIPPDPLPQDPGAPNAPDAEVFRFLEQATYGPVASDRAAVKAMGMSAWINQQMNTPTSSIVDYHLAANEWERDFAYNKDWDDLFTPYRRNTNAGIWSSALDGRDQLRQRMAFALSEIFVVSTEDNSVGSTYLGRSHYWDMLAGHAFGNFRDLLEDVSRHPVMGIYLSHLRNRKANDAAGTKPDENYAREVMQLFTIGLLELHPDGSLKLDSESGQPIPTYTNTDISELARFFTGFAYARDPDGLENDNFFFSPNNSNEVVSTEMFAPMKMFEDRHDFGEKTILKDVVIPADLEMEVEIDLVMDALFYHENTPPFIARRLIQRLTTSNPSPGYIYRVAQAFIDNGQGVRGDMAAVTRAILLDQEVRNPVYHESPSFGKTKEPLLRFTAAMRTLSFTNALPIAELGPYGLNTSRYRSGAFRVLLDNTDAGTFDMGQSFQRAPTVFNWFLPDYSPSGVLSDNNLYAPETQILTDNFLVDNINANTFLLFYTSARYGGSLARPDGLTSEENAVISRMPSIKMDLSEFESLALPDLVDEIDDRFFGGRMSAPLRNSITSNLVNINDNGTRARAALALAFISPEFASQR